MNRRRITAFVAGLALLGLVVALVTIPALADGEKKSFRAGLSGLQEVPAVSTTGHGLFKAKLDPGGTTLEYELTYADLEGTASAAHIHFGRTKTNGGVIAFLCGGDTKPACPAEGTVTGTIVAADVTGPATQGISAGEFEELLRAMRKRATYVNVHTDTFPEGEIRGQIRPGRSRA